MGDLRATFPVLELFGAKLEGFFASECASCHRGFTIALNNAEDDRVGGLVQNIQKAQIELCESGHLLQVDGIIFSVGTLALDI